MFARVFSTAVVGVEGVPVEAEVNNSCGAETKTQIFIVGLPDAAVRESRDRVTSAISNSALRWPDGHTIVNLAPADLRKEGPSAKALWKCESWQILQHSFADNAKHSGRES